MSCFILNFFTKDAVELESQVDDAVDHNGSSEGQQDTEVVEGARKVVESDVPRGVSKRSVAKACLLTTFIDLTEGEEFDERSDALHVAFEAGQHRSDAQINALNRLIDELEADKARLSSTLNDLESK